MLQRSIAGKSFYGLLVALLAMQFFAGLWHIGDPFVDGSQHYNWGPPFWLMKAQDINAVGLPATYFGLKDYASHPELIGPVISLWTQVGGYSEASIRMLSLVLTMLATLFLILAIREYLDGRKALLTGAIFACLPLVYIFGKKLDQEALVLVFLALTLWGLGRLQHERSWGTSLLFAGGLGMMLSDWSGAVFAFALGLLCLSELGVTSTSGRRGTLVLWLGAALGLLVFILQSYLQSGAHTISAYSQNYIDVWKYRAGLGSVHLTPFVWLGKQYFFAQINYTIPVLLAGAVGLWTGLRKAAPVEHRKIATLGATIFAASVAYMAAVPQASAIHIYFQYFLSVPIAIGLLLLVYAIAEWWKPREAESYAMYLGSLLFIALSITTAFTYNKFLTSQYGDVSDIQLLKSLRTLPEGKTVVAADNDGYVRDWFMNPNIRYYSGRDIPTYSFDEGVEPADYMVVRKEVAPQIQQQLADGTVKKQAEIQQPRCSQTFCLIKI